VNVARGRITPLARNETDPESRRTLCAAFPRASRYFDDAPGTPPLPGILGLFARHAEIAGPWLAYNGALLDHGALDPRVRELLILAVVGRLDATYVWQEHIRIAGTLGVSHHEIDALRRGDRASWSARDRVLLGAVDELLDHWSLGDDTWTALAEDFDERELLEVLLVVGTYTCLGMVVNGVGLAPPDVRGPEPAG
jgi:alkylhydroperoxidase family enzyme